MIVSKRPMRYFVALSACLSLTGLVSLVAATQISQPVGVAQIDVTPDYPVRLSGFGGRRAESEGVTQRIFAKAIAFANSEQGPAILITADNICVPDEITQEVAQRL